MKKILIFVIVIFLLSCQKNVSSVIGDWVQPIPGQNGVQGMHLKEGGVASSIGMQTLLYESWWQKKNKLVLRGRSLGNGMNIPFIDTLVIQKVTPDTLILKRGILDIVYTRDRDSK